MSYGYDDSGYGGSSGGGKSARVRESLEGYVDVPQRIAEFKAQYPDGRLRPADPMNPVRVVTVDGWDKAGQPVRETFLEYVALAYRDPDDTLPGVGVAWEHFPGLTTYTRNSEAMNAETSAWGRAIVAALIADAKAGVSTRQEVRNRRAEQEQETEEQRPEPNLAQVNPAIDLLYAATNPKEMAAAWKMAGSFWLHDTEIPGRDAGFLYRHLWKERMDQLTAERQAQLDAAHGAGLGEETGDPQVAPQSEGDGSPDDVAATGTDEAVAAVTETLDGAVVESPEATGE